MTKMLFSGLLLAAIVGVVSAIDLSISKVVDATTVPSTEPSFSNPKKQLWTCGMHPQVVQDHSGNCPICHMKLTPMRATEGGTSSTGGPPAVVIDPAVVQNMGVRAAEVTRGPIVRSIRTVGVLEAPETGLHDISPKVGGWIDRLYANQEGMHVQKGDPLFDLYSPDLVVAEEELVGAVKSLRALGPTADASLRRSSESLVESAKRKLRLLDVPDADIESVAEKLVAARAVTFRSPASGAVVEKAIVQGSSTQAGQKLMRIEDHGTLWLQLQVYEQQMPLVAVGDEVRATVESIPGKTFDGRITFVHPHVDPMSRTVMARAELENQDRSLKPGMYASATVLSKSVEDAVQVPRESVIDNGVRKIAFVAQSEGHFEPRAVRTGIAGDDGRVQILDGLSPGEAVVTSGQFLLDVESRTTEAIEKLRSSSSKPPPVSPAAEPTAMAMPMAGPKATTEPMESKAAPSTPATMPTKAALSVAWCPMKKVHWLQNGDAIKNPYYGTEMIDCGEVQRTATLPDPSSPITPVISAYSKVQEALAADKLEKASVTALQQSADRLNGSSFAEVRSAVKKLASSADVANARAAFGPLSEALLKAVDSSSAPSNGPRR